MEAQTLTDATASHSETGESVEELLAYLTTESQRTRNQTKQLRYGIWSVLGFVILAAVFLGFAKGEWDATSILLMSGLFTAGIAMASTDKMKDAARQLAQYNDVRAVGAFVEALEWSEQDIVSLAESKLIELLPRLQASDTNLLNTEQRATLNQKLVTADSTFAKAILKAYEQVGDGAAIQAVEKLTSKAGTSPDVVEAAQACLPFLIERAKQQEQAQTLLRAANGSATAPEMLLRPANATLENQLETLLRPSQF